MKRENLSNIEKIDQILKWYQNHLNHENIPDLLKIQDRIAIISYRMAEELSEIKKEYNLLYFARKIEFNKQKNHLINEMNKKNYEADASANMFVEEIQKDEVEYESAGYKLETLLRQLNKVMDSLQQRISYLKIEQQKTPHQNQT